MSKRKLLQLVQDGDVSGWDDPRMPTLAGLKQRGYTPESIRDFCDQIGVGKSDSWIDMSILEECVRNDLNVRAPRAMAVLRPLRVVIDNFPEDLVEEFDAANHPNDPAMGSRKVPFAKVIYIEQEDFLEEPPKGFFRLAPGREVRLRYAYIVKCESIVRDAAGNIVEVHCSYDPDSKGGSAADGRKIKGTIHWVSAAHAIKAEVRLYDRLFTVPHPDRGGQEFKSFINADSLQVLTTACLEPDLAKAAPGSAYQFERQGYFYVSTRSGDGTPVFNRTATLRDSWASAGKKE